MEKTKVELMEDFIIKVVDKGDSADVLIRHVNTKEDAEHVVQAIAKLITAAAHVLSESPHFCGHMACIFNGIGHDAVAEFRTQFPEEFERARMQAVVEVEGQHEFRTKPRGANDPIH